MRRGIQRSAPTAGAACSVRPLASTGRFMRAAEVTVEWLRSICYTIQSPYRPPTIGGVVAKDLQVHLDGRGDVIELWSKPWIESEGLVYPAHVYQSATDYGVVKCWHLHDIHTDQFTVTRGKLQVTLVDIRPDSPTFGHVNPIFLGGTRPRLIKIPPMVMHGWKALSEPEVIVVNLQSHVYDARDEFKFPWDCVLADVWEPKNG
jgi:dTDP-4-dehydrorhamnose 3,5-epimerase